MCPEKMVCGPVGLSIFHLHRSQNPGELHNTTGPFSAAGMMDGIHVTI